MHRLLVLLYLCLSYATCAADGDAIHIFCKENPADPVEYAKKHPELLKDKTGRNVTVFHWAVVNDQADLVTYLIANKWDVNAPEGNGWTPLHLAAYLGRTKIVKLLLNAKAKCDILTIDHPDASLTLRPSPVTLGTLSDAVTLLGTGNDSRAYIHTKTTPLNLALSNGYLHTAELLIDADANVNLANAHGTTPLMFAQCHENSEDLIKLLLKHKADPNLQAEDGSSSLHVAVAVREVEIVKLLLEAKADLTLKNKAGQTPLEFGRKKDVPKQILKLVTPKKDGK